MLIRTVITLLFCAFLHAASFAQYGVQDSVINMKLISLSYAVQEPGGDMADRFGTNSNMGIHFLIKNKKNWLFGFEGQFLFGNKLQDLSHLDEILTSDGNIVTVDGRYGRVLAFERGHAVYAQFGKILPIKSKPNPNSGIMLKAGVGYMRHRIKITVEDENIPQLSEDRRKGYDRLSSGIAFQQFIGYRYFSNKRLINFFAGFEFQQGLTMPRRSWDWGTNSAETEQRNDLLYGFRFGWTLPIYKRAPQDFYMY